MATLSLLLLPMMSMRPDISQTGIATSPPGVCIRVPFSDPSNWLSGTWREKIAFMTRVASWSKKDDTTYLCDKIVLAGKDTIFRIGYLVRLGRYSQSMELFDTGHNRLVTLTRNQYNSIQLEFIADGQDAIIEKILFSHPNRDLLIEETIRKNKNSFGFETFVRTGGESTPETEGVNLLEPAPVAVAPPATWQEHWFEHDRKVKQVYSDNDVAVYYDDNMSRSVIWPQKTLSDAWRYVKAAYGDFGKDPRLYVVLHAVENEKFGGGHPASYFDESHDYRNVIDCGVPDWQSQTGQDIGIPIHELGHIVTGASYGSKGSPSDSIWGDSKFMEIFNYDVLLHIGRPDEAMRVFLKMQNQTDSFPRKNTCWFKDWFYPIYEHYGQAAVLSKYLKLLSLYFPKNGVIYSRNLNFGEFIHFWSGAAGTDLRPLAEKAFGWTQEWQTQFKLATKTFPALHYKQATDVSSN